MSKDIILSSLSHTWFIDIDGTVFKHNGYLLDGKDSLLPGVYDFFNSIPKDDFVVLVTSRLEKYKEETIKCLQENQIRYDKIIFECPMGERIVVNDDKPGGLKTGVAINLKRNEGLANMKIKIDEDL